MKQKEQKLVIALSCSPSRGRNSDSMLDAFLEGVRKVDGVRAEKVYLEDVPIDHYRHENSKGPLPQETAFRTLTEQLRDEATGLVIATPTYNFSVPAHLKNFLDRVRWIALDFTQHNRLGQPVGKLTHLKCYFIASGGTPSWVQKLFFWAFPPFWLRAVFLYFGAEVMGGMYSGDTNAYQKKRLLATCTKHGTHYARKLARACRHGILERIFIRPPQRQ